MIVCVRVSWMAGLKPWTSAKSRWQERLEPRSARPRMTARRRALSTILDSNITTFIAAAVLFYIGTGPVRGFAVTLGIGIITTVFTSFTLTSLIVAGWVRWKRPKTVPI